MELKMDIPKTDIVCWDRYTKHRWVYDLSRLLDAQHIKWSLVRTDQFNEPKLNVNIGLHSEKLNVANTEPGYIFIEEQQEKEVNTEVFIIKGEIKHLRHTKDICSDVKGEIEIRINAFITLYFQKFTGIICVTTIKNNIYAISLKPQENTYKDKSPEIDKLIKKIYKKAEEIPHIDLVTI
jgi:hypothetical protein